jgi:hypothetical protein
LGRLKTQTNVYTTSQIQTLTNAYNQALALYNSKFGTSTPRTPTEPLPTFTNVATMSCDGLTAEITRIENIVRTTRFSSTAIADAYNRQLASAKTLKTSKCNVVTPPPPPNPPLPTFPNFETLNCGQLISEINKIQNTMSTSRFGSAQVTEAYTRALANAKKIHETKCLRTPYPLPPKKDGTPCDLVVGGVVGILPNGGIIKNGVCVKKDGTTKPVDDCGSPSMCKSDEVFDGCHCKKKTTTPPVPELPKDETKEEKPAPVGGGGGAIGGGGGGGATDEGLGEQPTAEGEQPIEEEQKPNNSWLWILLVIGGIYLMIRKGKKNS